MKGKNMKFDRFLEILFGRLGASVLLIAAILALLLGTGCTDEDLEKGCGDYDQVEDDIASVFMCGCLTPETTCNIISCAGERGCEAISDGFYACGGACDSVDDGAAAACGSCFDACDLESCGAATACGSCISSCLGMKSSGYVCNYCHMEFDKPGKTYVSYRDTYLPSCPYCGNTSIDKK